MCFKSHLMIKLFETDVGGHVQEMPFNDSKALASMANLELLTTKVVHVHQHVNFVELQ